MVTVEILMPASEQAEKDLGTTLRGIDKSYPEALGMPNVSIRCTDVSQNDCRLGSMSDVCSAWYLESMTEQ